MTQMELLHVHELLRAEELAARKYSFLASQAQDPQLQSMCRQAADHHLRHMQTLLNQLQAAAAGPFI